MNPTCAELGHADLGGGVCGWCGEDVEPVPAACPLDACRVCTGCAHGNHGACRQAVTCPDDRATRTCRCCGAGRG